MKLTDLPRVVPLLKENILRNKLQDLAQASPLEWGNESRFAGEGFGTDQVVAAHLFVVDEFHVLRTYRHAAGEKRKAEVNAKA